MYFFIEDNTWQTRIGEHKPASAYSVTASVPKESSKAKKEKPGSGNTNRRGDKNILNYNPENKKSQTLHTRKQQKENFVLYNSVIRGVSYCSSTHFINIKYR